MEQLATYKMSHESSAATLGYASTHRSSEATPMLTHTTCTNRETGGGADARVAQLEAELEEERQQAARAADSAAEHQRKLQDAVADATAAMERASEENSNLRQQLKSGDKVRCCKCGVCVCLAVANNPLACTNSSLATMALCCWHNKLSMQLERRLQRRPHAPQQQSVRWRTHVHG